MSDTTRYLAPVFEQRFHLRGVFTKQWFQLYVDELTKHAGKDSSVSCEVITNVRYSNRHEFKILKEWLDYVLANWMDVDETYIWYSGLGAIVRARCNHRRQWVVLSVREGELSTDDLEQLREKLQLDWEPLFPYKYRRSSLEFEIGDWKPDQFAVGVRRIAEILGQGSEPDLPEAYAKRFSGVVETLTPFYRLDKFCAEVGKKADLFGEISIRMDCRSTTVGIFVNSEHKKLRIRTNIIAEETDRLISAWPDSLSLKPIKSIDTGSGSSSAPIEEPKKKLSDFVLPVVAAIFTSGAVTGALTQYSTTVKFFWPDYTVVVTQPTVEKGKATLAGGGVTINWYIKPDQLSWRGNREDAKATVKISSTKGKQFVEIPSSPPISTRLDPGEYEVAVDAKGATGATFQLQVQLPLAKPPL